MRVTSFDLPGPVLFTPEPHFDARGFFTRTFDAQVAAEHGLDPTAFIQDSQSRSSRGVVRGMHGRSGAGEGKLVRCAHGAILDVLVDIRTGSATFGEQVSIRLDDQTFAHLYVPPGFLHGFQVLGEVADVCYRIDRAHDPSEDLAVRYDDPELAIDWPVPVGTMSERDLSAGTFAALQILLKTRERD
ncbi:dTDP-4-dehydrorhamnose 3,5-epimerase [Allobranchiibius huperziae]|uniref:dTDP-4-dehydrorhamnose 3,5-epimerase n=1 Tax=Allobranchiibius huperziae TaxID=1874116 RepID=A0A853DFE6_9MICO|nr:dTDP-4-dehydrorhamnose 3,5-epimerase [Allobranchiibius huperziae]